MSNYKAIVAKVDQVLEIPNADNIQIAKVLGESVVVSKQVQPGFVGVFFCAGCQLSESFAKHNNLYRKSENNADTTKSGFFEDNRRVRAQPFLKIRSEGYFTDLSSLEFIPGVETATLKVGDAFEELKGVEVCRKYINPKTLKAAGNAAVKAKKVRDVPLFEKHVDTAQFRHKLRTIEPGSLISIQAKVHGTSARVGKHMVNIGSSLPWYKRFANNFGNIFPVSVEQLVIGTRNVILDDPNKESFHGKEEFRFEVAKLLEPYLESGMTVYGEIAGYVNDKPVMPAHNVKALKDKKMNKKYGTDPMIYKYRCVEGTYRFHVYRITVSTEEGRSIDFTQQQIVQWCNDRGLIPALDVCEPFIFDGDYDALQAKVEALGERPECLTEDYIDPSHVGEGVIVRIDTGNRTPTFLKYKSYAFKVMEGLCDAVDTEEVS